MPPQWVRAGTVEGHGSESNDPTQIDRIDTTPGGTLFLIFRRHRSGPSVLPANTVPKSRRSPVVRGDRCCPPAVSVDLKLITVMTTVASR